MSPLPGDCDRDFQYFGMRVKLFFFFLSLSELKTRLHESLLLPDSLLFFLTPARLTRKVSLRNTFWHASSFVVDLELWKPGFKKQVAFFFLVSNEIDEMVPRMFSSLFTKVLHVGAILYQLVAAPRFCVCLN